MILVFESHPVQYRVPLYRKVAEILGEDKLKVIYGSDFSIRSYRDQDFGGNVEWNMDLTSGYQHQFLQTQRDPGLRSFRSLGGAGIKGCFDANSIEAILLTSLRFEFDFVALYHAKRRGIPVLLRSETQDHAFVRSRLKEWIRRCVYRMAYKWIDQVLPIGKLNEKHYQTCGITSDQTHYIRYCVPNPFLSLNEEDKNEKRHAFRNRLGIPDNLWLVGFSGKLIPKKDPALVLEATALANQNGAGDSSMGVLMVGRGKLSAELESRAKALSIPVWFPGFLDQNQIADAYLAMDCLMLPSRRMGETWGLVVNEALQAGCSIVMSDAVGCSEEFGKWDRVRVIGVGDVQAGARALSNLANYSRDWNWCRSGISNYSIDAAALACAQTFQKFLPQSSCI